MRLTDAVQAYAVNPIWLYSTVDIQSPEQWMCQNILKSLHLKRDQRQTQASINTHLAVEYSLFKSNTMKCLRDDNILIMFQNIIWDAPESVSN